MVPPQLTTNALYLQTFPASLSLSGVHGAAHKNSTGHGGEGRGKEGERAPGRTGERLIELYSLTWDFPTW